MAIACYATGSTAAYNYLRGEFHHEPFEHLEEATAEAYTNGWLGKNILGSGIDIDIHNVLGAGAYICGEETALMESLEGKKGQPRYKPPFPANFGLYGKPTTINNTETYASVPAIIRNGAEWFLNLGKPNNGGPKVFSVSGHVAKPGNYEIRLGTSFADLLQMAGGVRNGHKLKAVIPGGSSMPVLPADTMMSLTMDYDALQKAGSGLGSGAVIVMDETTCMVRACQRIARFYFAESCGQCTPCREGTGWMYRMLTRIVDGQASLDDLQMLQGRRGPDRRPHHLRIRRSRGVAGAGLPAPLLERIRIRDRQRALPGRRPARGHASSAAGGRMSAQPVNPNLPPDHVTVFIDDVELAAPKGSMIIHAADKAGIPIPRFCYHDKLAIAANCRMCLVEVEKAPKPAPACATPVMDGMKVRTRSDKALKAQRNVMEFLLINHPLDCPVCDQGGECELQDLSLGYGRSVSRFSERKRVVADEDLGPLVATDMTRCIQCTRCVRFTAEIAGTYELGGMLRGENLQIGTYDGKPLTTELSGNVIDVCPVGALTNKVFRFRARPWELIAQANRSATTMRWAATCSCIRAAATCCARCRATTKPSTSAGCPIATVIRTRACMQRIARSGRWSRTAASGAKRRGMKRWRAPRRSCATTAPTSSACWCIRRPRTRRARCWRAWPKRLGTGNLDHRIAPARSVRRRRRRSIRHARRRDRAGRRDRHRRFAPAP